MTEIFTNIISGVGIKDVIDIAIIAFVVYKVLGFIRETRAEQLVKGILILVLATFLSDKLNLYTLNWLLVNTMTIGVVALLIVFQPELRRALEYLGRSKFISKPFARIDKEKAKAITSVISKTMAYFSANKIGALIILEGETTLSDIAETGTQMESEISLELLRNVFYSGAPLHDGAVLIRGDRITAAGCVLPLTANKTLSKDLGTRHRAGLGITENSDAIALIVSEESGIISIAVDGKLSRFLDIKTVEKTILNVYFREIEQTKQRKPLKNLFRRKSKDA